MTDTAKTLNWALLDSNQRPLQCECCLQSISFYLIDNASQFHIVVKVQITLSGSERRMSRQSLHNRHWMSAGSCRQKGMTATVKDFAVGHGSPFSGACERAAQTVFSPSGPEVVDEDVVLVGNPMLSADGNDACCTVRHVDFANFSESAGFVVRRNSYLVFDVRKSQRTCFTRPGTSQPKKPQDATQAWRGGSVQPQHFVRRQSVTGDARGRSSQRLQWIRWDNSSVAGPTCRGLGHGNPRLTTFNRLGQQFDIFRHVVGGQVINHAMAKSVAKAGFAKQSSLVGGSRAVGNMAVIQEFQANRSDGSAMDFPHVVRTDHTESPMDGDHFVRSPHLCGSCCGVVREEGAANWLGPQRFRCVFIVSV